MKDKIKGFIGVTVGAIMGGETMQQVGGAMTGGIGSATQSMVGIGVLGHAASLSKKLFKWK